MRAFVLGIAALSMPVLIAQQPDAAGVLHKVGETYANAKQYRFAVKKSGEEAGFMAIAVRKPNQFRFEADGRVIDGADAFGNVTMVSNGDTVWNYISGLQQYTRKSTTLPLLDTEPPDITPEAFVLQAETVFLTRYAELAKATDHATFIREETIQGADCYVIRIQAPLPGFRDDYTWWVDKKRYLILREDTQPSTPRRPSSSTIYTLATIDEPIPEELFHFTPPPGSKLVEKFGE